MPRTPPMAATRPPRRTPSGRAGRYVGTGLRPRCAPPLGRTAHDDALTLGSRVPTVAQRSAAPARTAQTREPRSGAGAPPLTLMTRVAAARRSVHVDELDLDGVVPVAEAVPWRHVGLHVAGGVGGPRSKGVSSHVDGVPVEGPVLPLGGALRWFELSRVPVAFAGEADVDAGDGPGPGPGFAADRVGARVDGPAPGAGSVIRARTRMRLRARGPGRAIGRCSGRSGTRRRRAR